MELLAQLYSNLNSNRVAAQPCANQDAAAEGEEEVAVVDEAVLAGVLHVLGRTRLEAEEGAGLVERVMLGFYEFLHRNCRPAEAGTSGPGSGADRHGVRGPNPSDA